MAASDLPVYTGSPVSDPALQRRIIFSVAFVSFMASLDSYVVNISLPTIAKSFNVGTGEVSWVVLSYLLTVTATLLIFGRMGDRIGIRKVFMAGFVIFTGTSALCGLSLNLGMLVFARFLQGIGGSMLLGMAPAMIPKFLPKEKRGETFGWYATSSALGITMGTPLGGIITGFFSWHWIFLINLPVGIWAILYCRKAIPDDSVKSRPEDNIRFDIPGALLIFTGLSLLVYSLNMGAEKGWTSPRIQLSFWGGVILSVLFILWERKIDYPILDLDLFRFRAFTLGNMASCFAVAFQAGSNFLLPFYLERILNMKPHSAGLVILVYSLIYMLGSLFTGKISDRINPRLLCTWGMVVGALASFGFAFTLESRGIVAVVAFLVAMAVSYAMFIPSNNNLVMGMAPPGKQGIVSGVFRMGIYISLVAGVCFFETVFNIVDSASDAAGVWNVPAFRLAYILGGVFCILSVVFSLLSVEKKSS